MVVNRVPAMGSVRFYRVALLAIALGTVLLVYTYYPGVVYIGSESADSDIYRSFQPDSPPKAYVTPRPAYIHVPHVTTNLENNEARQPKNSASSAAGGKATSPHTAKTDAYISTSSLQTEPQGKVSSSGVASASAEIKGSTGKGTGKSITEQTSKSTSESSSQPTTSSRGEKLTKVTLTSSAPKGGAKQNDINIRSKVKNLDKQKANKTNAIPEPLKPDSFYAAQNLTTLRLSNVTEHSPTFVLLVTYARSGSTWLGDITHQSADSFYVYEPLFRLVVEGYYKKGQVCFNNNTCREPRTLTEKHEFALTSLQRIFTCQFEKLHPNVVRILARNVFMNSLRVTNVIGSCKRPHFKLGSACLEKLRTHCLESQHRILKTIRVSMDLVDILLDILPNLKIINLVRDPRGMTNSRNHGPFSMGKRFPKNHSLDTCSRLREDQEIIQRLQTVYPDRLTVVLYEALTEKPYEGAEYVYKFLDMPITEYVIEWVFKSTHAQIQNRTSYFSTARADAVAIASHWRTQMVFSTVQTIDNACVKTYPYFGFLPLPSLSKLRSLKYPSRKPVKNFDGFI